MKYLATVSVALLIGFVAGSFAMKDHQRYMESEAAHLETEMAGMKKMQEAMRNLMTGVCVR